MLHGHSLHCPVQPPIGVGFLLRLAVCRAFYIYAPNRSSPNDNHCRKFLAITVLDAFFHFKIPDCL